MTNATPAARTTTEPTARTLVVLRDALRTRRAGLAERRAAARTIAAYPASRSAAVVLLPEATRAA